MAILFEFQQEFSFMASLGNMPDLILNVVSFRPCHVNLSYIKIFDPKNCDIGGISALLSNNLAFIIVGWRGPSPFPVPFSSVPFSNGASLAAFEMPGELSGGPVGPGPVEGSVAVWFDANGTWVEHEWSPVPPGGAINFSPGVTKIQLRGIDRSAPDPADNRFNAGLYFDGATTGAQVTISNVSGPSLVPVINLLLGN
jgi:hypothetical protein